MTRGQQLLLKYIGDFIAQNNGVVPSYGEMKTAMNMKSKSGIYRMIIALEERGLIRRLPHRARAIEIVRYPATPGCCPTCRRPL